MLHRVLAPQAERAYALLRILAGLAFAFHGVQKIFGVLSDVPPPSVGDLHWFAGIIELVCGFAIAVGFQTPWAAFLASGQMAYAYIVVHWAFQFDAQFFPAKNRGELAFIYCFLFLYMACKGSGIWSVDRLLARSKTHPPEHGASRG